jgi:hypothetical protein
MLSLQCYECHGTVFSGTDFEVRRIGRVDPHAPNVVSSREVYICNVCSPLLNYAARPYSSKNPPPLPPPPPLPKPIYVSYKEIS